jgi:hypothetical protein
MRSSSDELVLDIKTQRSNENPYEYNKPRRKRSMDNGETDYVKYIFVQIVSVVLLCFFYALMVKPKRSYLEVKFYHSLSLGVLCLFDYLFSQDQYNLNIKEEYDSNTTQHLLEKDEPTTYMSKKEIYFISLIYGLVCFAIELLIFLILTYSVHYNNTLINGFCLLCLEIVVIRLHHSYGIQSNDFTTSVGMLLVLSVFLYDDVVFFQYTMGKVLVVALLIAALKYIRFTIYYELNKRYRVQSLTKMLFYANAWDFIIGTVILAIYLSKAFGFRFNLYHCFIVFMGTICYYFNMKFFTSNR